jgi:hypothetical protein
MKIIVESEAEKELMGRFLEVINSCDVISSEIQAVDKSFPEEQLVNSVEYDFIEEGFFRCKIEVGKTAPMEQEDTVITGTCIVCGCETEGTVDGDDISYEEYLEYEKQRDTWKCENCLNKESEQS